jgi:DNA-binding response OmpR family regulator
LADFAGPFTCADSRALSVVFMSAGAQLAIASEDLGAAAYVSKPVVIGDLLAIVRRHCES